MRKNSTGGCYPRVSLAFFSCLCLPACLLMQVIAIVSCRMSAFVIAGSDSIFLFLSTHSASSQRGGCDNRPADGMAWQDASQLNPSGEERRTSSGREKSPIM